MTTIPTDVGTLLVSAALASAVGIGYYRDPEVVALLVDRFTQMLPTTFNYVALTGVGAVIEIVGSPATASPAALLAGALALTFTWCGSWFMNDMFDKEPDQATEEQRATADGRLTDRQTLTAAIVLGVASLAYAALLSVAAFAAAVSIVVLNVVYSVPPLRLKASATGSMACIGLMGASAIMLGSGTVTVSPSTTAWQFAAAIVILVIPNLSYKDLKDAEEDAEAGVDNFVVSFGKDRVRWFLVVSFPVTYLLGTLVIGVTTLPALAAVVGVGFLASGLLVTHDPSTPALVYRLDVVNAIYLLCLAGSYYVIYA